MRRSSRNRKGISLNHNETVVRRGISLNHNETLV